jgi:hypothetical protein
MPLSCAAARILLASARLERVPSIARALSCDEQAVRNALHAFNQQGREALEAGSNRPHHLRMALSAEIDAEAFKAALHRPPRDFGFETSLWRSAGLFLFLPAYPRRGGTARPG